MTTLRGGCHCGNVSVAFETEADPNMLQLCECQCSFCGRHGGRTVTDARGRLAIGLRDAGAVVRYRFALGVTDFLVCKDCGVYVAATMEVGGKLIGTVNVRALDERELFIRRGDPVRSFRETAEQRRARRMGLWMPVEVRS